MRTPSNIARPVLLSRVLLIDAATTGASALLMCLAATPLAALTELPEGLLRGVGVALLPFAAWLARLGLGRGLTRATGWAVVVSNGLYALACLLVLMADRVPMNGLGAAFLAIQGVVVFAFAGTGALALGDRARPTAASRT